ncbi:thioredoxin domain-containing protein [uncultured Erythrobacter sp.]|uniref:thioredoxin domain-containing protein n=1 Tax=uncultured Erythrobacter sp. TaxID=263913 RepID=UPI002602B46D|nr:thioredoxin domain-containing protein [uncultured Erythrobacter sp.]
MKHLKRAALVAVSALGLAMAGGATAQETGNSENQLADPPSAFMVDKRRSAWQAEVVETDRGFMIGNPKAEASLIEWISYTCGHCADFAREGEAALDLALLAPGHMSVEVRPVIRNAIDLTVSLLVQCGGAEGFKDRHRMYLLQQDKWLEKARTAPQSQMASWASGSKASRISMAAALDLDDMLANRGASRMDINTCLGDDQAALALVQNGAADREEFAVAATPSFALDGELLSEVHTWGTLYPVIEERFKPQNSSQQR